MWRINLNIALSLHNQTKEMWNGTYIQCDRKPSSGFFWESVCPLWSGFESHSLSHRSVFGDKFRTGWASVSIHGTVLPPTDGSLLLLQVPCWSAPGYLQALSLVHWDWIMGIHNCQSLRLEDFQINNCMCSMGLVYWLGGFLFSYYLFHFNNQRKNYHSKHFFFPGFPSLSYFPPREVWS